MFKMYEGSDNHPRKEKMPVDNVSTLAVNVLTLALD